MVGLKVKSWLFLRCYLCVLSWSLNLDTVSDALVWLFISLSCCTARARTCGAMMNADWRWVQGTRTQLFLEGSSSFSKVFGISALDYSCILHRCFSSAPPSFYAKFSEGFTINGVECSKCFLCVDWESHMNFSFIH